MTLSWIDITNFMIISTAFAISILGLMAVLRVHHIGDWERRFLTIFFGFLIAYSVSAFSVQISLTVRDARLEPFSALALFLESLFSSLLMPMLCIYLLHLCQEPVRCALFYVVSALWSLYLALLIFTQFSKDIYYFEENVYHRGPLYPVLLIPPILLLLTALGGLIRRRAKLSDRQRISLFVYISIPMIAMLIQAVSYGIRFIVLGTAIATIFLFFEIFNDQVEQTIRQEQALNEKQFHVRTLQMRPHFIYNTLSNIYYLCDQDPSAAKDLIDNFLTYLRKNFSAMDTLNMLPFTDELEHVRAYLAVVQARFGDMLRVAYDIDYDRFYLPPLTLEPIVENAVKHNLDNDSPPLDICIRTKQLENGSMVIVENSGEDFSISEEALANISKDTSTPHIGIANVRERLLAMCGGTLTIGPRPEGGTIVTITLPDQSPASSSSPS